MVHDRTGGSGNATEKAAYGKAPTTSDWVYLTGTDLGAETPLVVAEGTTAKPKVYISGFAAQSEVVMRVDAGGSFSINGSGGDHGNYGFLIGRYGKGTIIGNGGTMSLYGSASVPCVLGRYSGGYGIVSNLSSSTRYNGLSLGHAANATGRVVVAGGTLYNNNWNNPGWIRVGAGSSGRGFLEMTGGSIDGCSGVAASAGGGRDVLYIGYGAGSEGVFSMSGGTLKGVYVYIGHGAGSTGSMEVTGGSASSTRTFYVGRGGAGTLDVKSNFAEGEMHIGGVGAGTGVVTVYEGATNTLQYLSSYNSGVLYVGGGTNSAYGAGLLALKGGSVRISSGNGAFNLGVGESRGTVRGWGRILPAVLNTGWTESLKLNFGSGSVVADGEGVERTLDFNDVCALNRSVTNALSGATNGWYAVNGGCVHFPYVDYIWASTVTRCMGDYRYSAEPDLVNSVRLSIRGTSGGALHGGFYASDRTDCHLAELPPNDGIVGVWKLGSMDNNSSNQHCTNWRDWGDATPASNMNTVSAKFRYDENAVPGESARLSLYRYESGAWKCVARKTSAADGGPTIETGSMDRLDGEAANIGTFALVARKPRGMTVILR